MQRAMLSHENKQFNIIRRVFDEFHGITAAIITLNEEEYLERCINNIRPYVDSVLVIDGESSDGTIEIAKKLADTVGVFPFAGHFANQKNNAVMRAYTDWTLLIDPDELLSEGLAKKLRELIDQDIYDCYAIPRVEKRDGKEITDIYPDYQARLFRTYCRYVRPVHEELVGYKKKCTLPSDHSCDLIHDKSLERHKRRNAVYGYFETHYIHETGAPGTQVKETFVMPMEKK